MSTRLVTVFAAAISQDSIRAQHERCSRWIRNHSYIPDDTLLIDGSNAEDSSYLCNRIRLFAEKRTVRTLVVESLSRLGSDRFEILALLDFLSAKSIKLVALKEAIDDAADVVRLLVTFGTFSPNIENRQCVYLGRRADQGKAQSLADIMGWDLSVPRSTRPAFEDRLALARGRTLVISNFSILPGKGYAQLHRTLEAIWAAQQEYYIVDLGLDSTAPNAVMALRAALVVHALPIRKPRRKMEDVIKSLPPLNEMLAEWASRRLKTRPGTIAGYARELGLNTATFFKVLRGFISEMLTYFETNPTNEAVAQRFSLSVEHVAFAFFWMQTSGRRRAVEE